VNIIFRDGSRGWNWPISGRRSAQKSQLSSGSCFGDGLAPGLEQGLPGDVRAALSTLATSSNR